MKIIVSGATSMIGIAIISKALERGFDVLAIVRPNSTRIKRLPRNSRLQIEFSQLDSFKNIEVLDRRYDVFYHLAWDYTQKEYRDNPVLQESNIRASIDAVILAHRFGCTKFIGAGSQAEFGAVKNEISENMVCHPKSSYGIAKYSAAMLCEKMCALYKINFVWPRVCSVYGCNDNDGTMINYAIGQFHKRLPANFSSAKQIWNYINEEDAGEMFLRFGYIEHLKGYYLVASSINLPLYKYINIISEIYDAEDLCNFSNENQMASFVQLNVNAKDTFNAISYKPKISFAEGIRRIKQNFSNNCVL